MCSLSLSPVQSQPPDPPPTVVLIPVLVRLKLEQETCAQNMAEELSKLVHRQIQSQNALSHVDQELGPAQPASGKVARLEAVGSMHTRSQDTK